MNNIISHRGYCGSVEYSANDDILFGSVIGIKGLISYEGKSIKELKEDFEAAVDEYLEMCEEEGVQPERAYKGVLRIRLEPELHRKAVIEAKSRHETLNEFIRNCIWDKVASPDN